MLADFFAVDFFAVDFLLADFFAVDFLLADLFADFFAVDLLVAGALRAERSARSSSCTRSPSASARRVAAFSSTAETRPIRLTDRSTSARTRPTSRSRFALLVAIRSSVTLATCTRIASGSTAPTPASPCATSVRAAASARSRVTSVSPLASWTYAFKPSITMSDLLRSPAADEPAVPTSRDERRRYRPHRPADMLR